MPWRLQHDLTNYDNNPQYTKDPFKRTRWKEDGFIDDFQAHTLGYETNNHIAFWTAVHGISSTIKRQASLSFGDGLFPNFFILIVAPPAVVRKSTALARFDGIENAMWKSNKNEPMEKLYRALVMRGKATSEQLFNSMSNKKVQINEETEPIMSDANLIIRVSELSVFFSKAQYNQGLIDKMTDFYDCKDFDTDSTIARGSKELYNIYCTMFACTTPDAFKGSIPETAFGGGFMSRCTVVNEQMTHRIIPTPYYPSNAPDREEMGQRLMWILQNKKGTYSFTPEAYDAYKEWYKDDIMKQRKSALEVNADHREGRKSITILKLALTFAIQRYTLDLSVTADDFERARSIVEYTNRSSLDMIENISVDVQEDGRFYKFRRLVKEAGEKGIDKRTLARAYRFKKFEIDNFIDEMRSRGEIKIKGEHLIYTE
jgi:hypothetical protein